VTTDDDVLADRIRVLRNYGSKKSITTSASVTTRVSTTSSRFLRVKLKKLDEWNDRRRAMARATSRLGRARPN